MIATITNHISKGVQNFNDTSKKFTWFKSNFNMPVPNYMYDNSPFDRYYGCWDYLTETTSYDLSGFVPGYEICVGHAIFDFENDSGSDYNLNTNLYVRWCHTDYSNFSPAVWIYNGVNVQRTILPGYYYEYWIGGNIGCAGWEIYTNSTERFTASASGTPNISATNTDVTFSNVPSTTQLDSSKAGYIWVEGNNLCYVCANLWKHTIVGSQVSTSPGVSKAGYIWIDTYNGLHWVGANGYDYQVPWIKKQFASYYYNSATGEVNAGTSYKGYMWVDNEYGLTHVAYIGYDGYKYIVGGGVNPYA
jgi:hypothetical protein